MDCVSDAVETTQIPLQDGDNWLPSWLGLLGADIPQLSPDAKISLGGRKSLGPVLCLQPRESLHPTLVSGGIRRTVPPASVGPSSVGELSSRAPWRIAWGLCCNSVMVQPYPVLALARSLLHMHNPQDQSPINLEHASLQFTLGFQGTKLRQHIFITGINNSLSSLSLLRGERFVCVIFGGFQSSVSFCFLLSPSNVLELISVF